MSRDSRLEMKKKKDESVQIGKFEKLEVSELESITIGKHEFRSRVMYRIGEKVSYPPLTCMLTPPLNHSSYMFNGSGLH